LVSIRQLWHSPWLALPAPIAHNLSQIYLKLRGAYASPRSFVWRSFRWNNLEFKNRLGIAGGVDKNADHLAAWWSYGVGFIEVGTITPLAQNSNPPPIFDRNNSKLAVWNKMGFPNLGVAHLKAQLLKWGRPYETPVFVNIGKNRETPNEKAHEDYLTNMRAVGDLADAFIVNISSPNTKGLRELLAPDRLTTFLAPLRQATKIPLLLKLSPDLSDAEFCTALDTSLAAGVDGWVLTNTTTNRDHTPEFSPEGGVSGAPLAAQAEKLLRLAISHLGARRKNKLLISVGGVLNAQDVLARLNLGADLVQVYSALIFLGPRFFEKVARSPLAV
jgi:dihydroorotate dehydrogenase